MQLYLIIICISLALMILCSAMEVAYITSNKLKMELEKKQSSLFGYIADRFARRGDIYLTTLSVGYNIFLVVYTVAIVALVDGSIAIAIPLAIVVVLIFVELLPGAIVRSNPNFYYRNLSLVTFILYLVLYPIAKIIIAISQLSIRIAGSPVSETINSHKFNRGDLEHLVLDIVEKEEDTDNDLDMKIFQNALDFSELRVRDCMVQRVDIEAIDIEEGDIEQLKELFAESQYSRIMVYRDTIDNIIGYINVKSLFRDPESLTDMVLDVKVVPESMTAQRLLEVLIRDNASIAVVIDEFGGTAGMVTLEDVLEEIFGEIEDEYDTVSTIEKVISDGEYLFSARLEIEYLNENYPLDIPESDEYDTLAGYIIYQNEDIPRQGEEFTFGSWHFRIIKISGSKIDLIKITKI